MAETTRPLTPALARSSKSQGRVHRRFAVAAACLLGVAVAGAEYSGTRLTSERALSDAWHRAVDADTSLVSTLGGAEAGSTHLHRVSTTETAKPPYVGDRVTVVAPDGMILSLRVCDPSLPGSADAPDCLGSYAARAVPAPRTPVAQRSL